MAAKGGRLAKLTRPRVHRAALRERLFSRLDETRTYCPGIWVVGPPGAGKTTLVASWLEARNIAGIWLQVDAADADLATFFHYLGRGAAPWQRREAPLPAFAPEYAADISGFARRFFRILFERLPQGAALVLDNYQEVAPDAAFHQVVSTAIEEVPAGAQLVIASRRDPPECYAPLVINERISLVDWSDLKLTLDEAMEISKARRRLDPVQVKSLHEKCEGWVAGLTLLLEQRQTTADASAEPRDRTQQSLFDYFASQIFAVASPESQQVLLHCALFPTVTKSLAQAITQIDSAGDVLDDLHRRRLFTNKHADQDARYQFHALFREFLLRRLETAVSRGERLRLLGIAAELLERDSDRAEDAVAMYCQAGNWPRAVALMLRLAPLLMGHGRWRTLLQWGEWLPVDVVLADPWLLYWQGMAGVQESIPRARESLTKAYDAFEAGDNAVGQMLSAAALIRTYHFEYNTFEPVDRWVAAIDALLASAPSFPTVSMELSVFSALLLAFTYRSPGHSRRSSAVARVTSLLDEPLDLNQIVSAGFALVLHHTLANEMDRALSLVMRIGKIADADTVAPLNRAYWWLFVGYFHHRRSDRASAQAALDLSDRIAKEHGLRQTEFISRCFRAYHCGAWRDVDGGLRATDGLESLLSESKPMLAAQYHNARVHLEMCRGDGVAAEHHAHAAVAAATRLGAPFYRVAWLSQAAAALALNGSFADAKAWLDAAWAESEGSFLESYRPMICATQAFTALCEGDREAARILMRRMFDLGRDEQGLAYLKVPVLAETVMRAALEEGIAVALAQTMVRSWDLPAPEAEVPHWPWPVRIWTLGGFRVEVRGVPLAFSRKTPRKTLSLLKCIVSLGGKDIAQHRLVDALWPDEAGDAANDAFAVSLYRLRKMLGHPESVIFADGLISLNRERCWVDAFRLQMRFAGAHNMAPAEDAAQEAGRLVASYGGPFLPDDVEQPWTAILRERLREGFLRRVVSVGRQLEEAGDSEAAADLYRRGIDADELAEDLHQGLMRCLSSLDRCAEALQVYRRLRQALSISLGVVPSAASEHLFRKIQQQGQSVPDR